MNCNYHHSIIGVKITVFLLYIELFFGDENNNLHFPGGTIPIFWNWNLQQLSSAQVFKCVLHWCFGEQQNLG